MVNYPVKPSDSAKCNSLIMTQLKQMLSAVEGVGVGEVRSGEMCGGEVVEVVEVRVGPVSTSCRIYHQVINNFINSLAVELRPASDHFISSLWVRCCSGWLHN